MISFQNFSNNVSQENKNLRKALNPLTSQAYSDMKRTEDQLDAARCDLEEARYEIKQLKVSIRSLLMRIGFSIMIRLQNQLATVRRKGSWGSDSVASSVSGMEGLENKFGLSDRLGQSRFESQDKTYIRSGEKIQTTIPSDDDESSYGGMDAVDLCQPIPETTVPSNQHASGPYKADSIDIAIAAEMKQYEDGLAEGDVSATLDEWEKSLLGGGGGVRSSSPGESWLKRYAQPVINQPSDIDRSPFEASPTTRRLPPSISQSFADHDIVDEKKKPILGRPTLLQARDHDLYESRVGDSPESDEADGIQRRLSHSPNTHHKRDHPLREALRTKSDKLAISRGAYSWDVQPLGKAVKLSPPVHRTPSPTRHSRHTEVPASRRYLVLPTDSSLAKMKRISSSRMAAARMPGDWH